DEAPYLIHPVHLQTRDGRRLVTRSFHTRPEREKGVLIESPWLPASGAISSCRVDMKSVDGRAVRVRVYAGVRHDRLLGGLVQVGRISDLFEERTRRSQVIRPRHLGGSCASTEIWAFWYRVVRLGRRTGSTRLRLRRRNRQATRLGECAASAVELFPVMARMRHRNADSEAQEGVNS